MKAYATVLNFFVFLVAAVLFSCGTKKQVSSTNNANIIVQSASEYVDSIGTDVFRPYYYPHLQYSNGLSKINAKQSYLTVKDRYELAFQDLKDMIEGKTDPNFEYAVFVSENPYHDGRFTYQAFQNSVTEQLIVIKNIIEANDESENMDFDAKVKPDGRFRLADIRYLPKEKKELYRQSLSNWAIFKYLTDTLQIYAVKDSSLYTFYHAPYSYSTEDPFGMKDWTHSQVMNLLISENNTGNCFALTGLYKILSDRLNADAKLCTAPQHIYIQHRDPKGHYYNVELATGGHPGDGIIQTLTYTPTEAIVSGVALRDYTAKQSIGLCLVNLAKSYEHKFKTKDDEFLLRCANLALKNDSLNLNALLLKAQVLDNRVSLYASKKHIGNINQLKRDTVIASTVLALEKHLALIQSLGYRQMPLDMQERIMNPLQYDPNQWDHKSRNPRPFTSFEPKDPKDAEYWSLTKGVFQEVFEPTKTETYGHFTLNNKTRTLIKIDTSIANNSLIDPVAFAYDFGERMYDARVGRFIAIDPENKLYPELSPYSFVNNSPLIFVDHKGRSIKPTNPDADKLFTVSTATFGTNEQLSRIFNIPLDKQGNLAAGKDHTYTSQDFQTLSIKDFGSRAKDAGLKLKGKDLQQAYSVYKSLSSKDIIELTAATKGDPSTISAGNGTVIVDQIPGYTLNTMSNGQVDKAVVDIINGTSTDPVQMVGNKNYKPNQQMGTVDQNTKGTVVIDQTKLKTADDKKGALIEGLQDANPAPRK